jgi:6-phosphogluconolactonase
LTVSGDNNFIYSVNKNGAESKVSSCVYSPSSGQLDFINLQNSIKKNPCYIINDKKNVFVANYSNGNSAVFGKKRRAALVKPNKLFNTMEKELILLGKKR